MRVRDDKALDRFRGPGLCELCRQWSAQRDAHHAFVKTGMGGGSRLDVPENIASLDRICHSQAEVDHGLNLTVRERVAEREGLDPAAILDALHAVIRLDRHDWNGLRAVLQTLRGRAGAHHQDRRRGGQLPGGGVGPAPDVRPSRLPADEEGWVPL